MGLTRDHSAKWVFLLFLPFVILLLSYSSARGQWASVTPPDVSTYWDLRGVHFTSADEGWAVGMDYSNRSAALLRTLSFLPKEGTVGTRFSFRDSYLGSKKGKVLIDNSAAKVINWDDSSIICEINKPLALGPHAVVVKPKEPKGVVPIVYIGAFIVMPPKITSADPVSGTEGAEITVSGNYFGSKKGKVYLVMDPSNGKKKNCKVTSWTMNPTDGTSAIKFIVPKVDAGNYWLYVSNKVGANPPGVPYQVN